MTSCHSGVKLKKDAMLQSFECYFLLLSYFRKLFAKQEFL